MSTLKVPFDLHHIEIYNKRNWNWYAQTQFVYDLIQYPHSQEVLRLNEPLNIWPQINNAPFNLDLCTVNLLNYLF